MEIGSIASPSRRGQRTGIIDEWNKLGDSEREDLLPLLLNRMTGWHAWSSTDIARLRWLERQFEKAGIHFRPSE